jgi:hypothetical protein
VTRGGTARIKQVEIAGDAALLAQAERDFAPPAGGS